MNYFDFHINDYAEATAHLSFVEDAAYQRLLRKYYATEAPLPLDLRALHRLVGARTKDEREAVETVLREFFVACDEGWRNKRADEGIAKYKAKKNKAAASANARWDVMRSHGETDAVAMPTQCEGNAPKNQEPITNNQEEKKGGAFALPDWLPPEAWQDWHRYRNSRKGWTQHARELSLRTLTELRAQGHEPRRVIDQSIERGWSGLFPIKGQDGAITATPKRRLKEL
jgi:uncharacterized protein YdaU (DUF1376 family)